MIINGVWIQDLWDHSGDIFTGYSYHHNGNLFSMGTYNQQNDIWVCLNMDEQTQVMAIYFRESDDLPVDGMKHSILRQKPIWM